MGIFDVPNINKIVREDEKFKDYAGDAALYILMHSRETQAFLATLYSFYQMGMTLEQVHSWINTMTSLQGDTNGQEPE